MQNNHFIHDLFIVIGISLLSTISIAISIFSRYGLSLIHILRMSPGGNLLQFELMLDGVDPQEYDLSLIHISFQP